MIALKHVLVATDFGAPSLAAFDYARAFARTFGAKVSLMHVVRKEADLDRVQRQLETMLGDGLRDGGSQALAVVAPRPADALLAYAENNDVDLIVAGTHGIEGLADFFMGSVAQQLVRRGSCPVLTLRCTTEHYVSEPVAAAPALF
jgi:nucleotide-binding universal stress UspA family protein